MESVSSYFMNYEKMLPKRCQRQPQDSKSIDFSSAFSPVQIIPTRCKDTYLNGFCLDHICSCSSEDFDSPYYPGYTVDAYQNLIRGDKCCDDC